MDSLNFDLTPIEKPVQIAGQSYTLHEASGQAARTYQLAMERCYKRTESGALLVEGMPELPFLLVSLCLTNGENKPVPLSTVQTWPIKVVRKLFEVAKEISELDRDDTIESLTLEKARIDEKIRVLKQEEEERKKLLSSTLAG